MTGILEQAQKLYALEDCAFTPVSGHEGGRNRIVIVSRNGEELDWEDMEDAAECLIQGIPYAGIGQQD